MICKKPNSILKIILLLETKQLPIQVLIGLVILQQSIVIL